MGFLETLGRSGFNPGQAVQQGFSLAEQQQKFRDQEAERKKKAEELEKGNRLIDASKQGGGAAFLKALKDADSSLFVEGNFIKLKDFTDLSARVSSTREGIDKITKGTVLEQQAKVDNAQKLFDDAEAKGADPKTLKKFADNLKLVTNEAERLVNVRAKALSPQREEELSNRRGITAAEQQLESQLDRSFDQTNLTPEQSAEQDRLIGRVPGELQDPGLAAASSAGDFKGFTGRLEKLDETTKKTREGAGLFSKIDPSKLTTASIREVQKTGDISKAVFKDTKKNKVGVPKNAQLLAALSLNIPLDERPSPEDSQRIIEKTAEIVGNKSEQRSGGAVRGKFNELDKSLKILAAKTQTKLDVINNPKNQKVQIDKLRKTLQVRREEGKVPVGTQEAISVLLKSENDFASLLTEFTTEERRGFVGIFKNPALKAKQLLNPDSRFALFQAKLGGVRQAVFGPAGKTLTPNEKELAEFAIPTGLESSFEDFEAKLLTAIPRFKRLRETRTSLATTGLGQLAATADALAPELPGGTGAGETPPPPVDVGQVAKPASLPVAVGALSETAADFNDQFDNLFK